MTKMLEMAKLTKPFDIVITSLGVNDVTSLQRTKHWLNEQNKLHQYCFQKLGAKHIIVSAMAGDGFHPGPRIYVEWGLNLSKRIVYIAKSLPNESDVNI